MRDRHEALLTLAGLVLVFGLVHNPYWVPTGDSEVFLVAARNVLNGAGLMYMDEPLRIVPPGWPLVLAGLIWVGGGWIVVLKLAQCVFMTTGLMLLWGVLRRTGTPGGVASACVLLGALCSPLYPLTFWLHSDALFVLLGGLATYAAVRSRDGGWRWVVLACVAACLGVAVRWAGVAFGCVVAGACVTGVPASRVRAMTVVGVCGAFFVVLYGAVALMPGLPLAAVAPDLLVRERPDLSPAAEVWARLVRLPDWLGWTFFAPMRFLAFGGGDAGMVVNRGVGWLATGLFAWHAVSRTKAGCWLSAGVGVYLLVLAAGWPFPNSRYVVPVLPLVVAGVLGGIGDVGRRAGVWLTVGLRGAFVAALVFVNGFMWAVDVWVARAPTPRDFYARYEAGLHLSLIEAAWYVRDVEGVVATSARYENLRERWTYPHAQRVVAYLADKPTLTPPAEATGWSIRPSQQWSRDNGVTWYVHQHPTVPGRLWHFRLSHAEHGRVMGDEPGPGVEQFSLYEMRDHAASGEPPRRWLVTHPVPPLTDDMLHRVVTRVPGL